jgi:hypothetical protein
MPDDRISQPVARAETTRDRPFEASHHEAIERARSRERRRQRSGEPVRPAAPGRASRHPGAPAADETRGTRLDVLA